MSVYDSDNNKQEDGVGLNSDTTNRDNIHNKEDRIDTNQIHNTVGDNQPLNESDVDNGKQTSTNINKLIKQESKKYQNIVDEVMEKIEAKNDIDRVKKNAGDLIKNINIVSNNFNGVDSNDEAIFSMIENSILTSDGFVKNEWFGFRKEVDLGYTPYAEYLSSFMKRLSLKMDAANDIGFNHFEDEKTAMIKQTMEVLILKAKDKKISVQDLDQSLNLIMSTNVKKISRLLKPKTKKKNES